MSTQLHAALVQANQQEIAVRAARGMRRRELAGDTAATGRPARGGRGLHRLPLITALVPRRA